MKIIMEETDHEMVVLNDLYGSKKEANNMGIRTELLDRIKSKYADWLAYGVVFEEPDFEEDDPFAEDCETELVLDEDGVKVWLEYEFDTIYITGLTKEEQDYIE